MEKKNLILIIRSGIAVPTPEVRKALRDIVADEDALANGAVISGKASPMNRNGSQLGVIETNMTAAEVAYRLQEADDIMPAICIDITETISSEDKFSITADANEIGLGKLFSELFGVEPQGEVKEEEENDEANEMLSHVAEKIEELKANLDHSDTCTCDACKELDSIKADIESKKGQGFNPMILLEVITRLEAIKGSLQQGMNEGARESAIERGKLYGRNKPSGGTSNHSAKGLSKRELQKITDYNIILDIATKRGGIDKLTESERARLQELTNG